MDGDSQHPCLKKEETSEKKTEETHTHTQNDTIKLQREPCKVWFGLIVTLHLSCSWFSPGSFSLLASGLDSGLVSALDSGAAVAITTKKKKNKKFGGFLKERIRKRPKGLLITKLENSKPKDSNWEEKGKGEEKCSNA